MRRRRFKLDVLINRAVLYGLLAAFIGAVYLVVVVGIGGAGTGEKPNAALSIAATVIVAVTFQPVRERARRLANRLVYGERATPDEVLSRFSEQLAGTYVEGVLPEMARILAEGTRAARAAVWLKVGSELVPAATWPVDAPAAEPAALSGTALPQFPGVDRAIPVRHQGELLGALTVAQRPGDEISPAEDKLLSDVASQAGLVLRNVGLTAELASRLEEIAAQAEELRASRQRIVAAQDAERRRLERNIHDGAQQHLVALAVKLRLARTLAGRDRGQARAMLAELKEVTAEAVETLRNLTRGIYSPLLAEQGVAGALRAQAGRAGLPVEVEAEGVGRYGPEVEAAGYFTCLEALQNAAKHARASRVVVRLEEAGVDLCFSVSDDGTGFDPDTARPGVGLQNMADRLAALEGSLQVRSAPGRGTTVTGRIPVRAAEPVA